jgi:hypothetical protein
MPKALIVGLNSTESRQTRRCIVAATIEVQFPIDPVGISGRSRKGACFLHASVCKRECERRGPRCCSTHDRKRGARAFALTERIFSPIHADAATAGGRRARRASTRPACAARCAPRARYPCRRSEHRAAASCCAHSGLRAAAGTHHCRRPRWPPLEHSGEHGSSGRRVDDRAIWQGARGQENPSALLLLAFLSSQAPNLSSLFFFPAATS